MQYLRTTDVGQSIRKAFSGYTHILVNRGYTTIKPVFFKSASIADLPVYVWAWWDRASDGQLARWRDTGGVLLDRYTYSDRAGPADVLVFVECPMTMDRLTRSHANTSEYTVVPIPHTWRVHEECIDLRTPQIEVLRAIWTACRGRRLTDEQLESETDIPRQRVTYMRKSLKPVEEWEMRPRLAPDASGLLPAWEWIGHGRTEPKKVVREDGHKAAIKEMARLGHISLLKWQVYRSDEPDWDVLERKRRAAIADLAEVRSLVESLPDHLQA
ncbi:hypothetical protein [Burkholderia pseudomultivorans]|uniref:Uncharacterized protein n=1 Tax=Burkholderia pseudomultivorans TaxID=1207504 RepID=A0ABU2DXR3_9BURK|nr:hypothetical protein [Burkholderia pseudomultivorans]MDR8728821.1 hypothetical protein [Burkholderia pseudomultivorans]MDR8733889.1 hypothetical protein [Burkholderia pseudomultivorans]MDR8742943.1 hypothetical protein [Burkholderia pseudomultivorans]MDR8752383.1 hypothetical protein [Burkholderia pseudomultivorans]MDR8778363.1 hypothetical protein [Burkholderia pseudomultivorans]